MFFPRFSLFTRSLLSALLVSTAYAQEASVTAPSSQPLTNEMAEAIKKEGNVNVIGSVKWI